MSKYVRRLQKVGSSFMISLPGDWIKRNKLGKASILTLDINRDNSISIFSSDDNSDATKEATLSYTPATMDSVVNQVYGAYLLGYDMIRIRSSSEIPFDDADRIKRAVHKLAGLEIVDEDAFKISAQFLLDAGTLDAEKILRRMNSIVSGMSRDVVESMNKKEKDIRRVVGSRDQEVNRHYFLLVRLIRSAMMDQRLAGKLNLSNIDILDYRIAANLLESAGDYIVDLAGIRAASEIPHIEKIVEAGMLVDDMQEKAVSAFVNKNRNDSLTVVRMYERFTDLVNSLKDVSSLNAIASKRDSSSTINFLNILYSLDKIARCWVDIADLVKPVHLTAPLKNA